MVLSFIQDRSEERWIPELRKFCVDVKVQRLPTLRSLWNCVVALPTRRPFQVAYFSSAEMRHAVQETIEEFQPAVIHTHLIRMAPYVAGLDRPGRVIDLTDAVSLYLRRFADLQRNPVKRIALSVELSRMTAYEPVIARFDRALVCSAVDRDVLKSNVPDAQLRIVENGVDLSAYIPRKDGEECQPLRVIFTGNMTYFPNADGARFLAREVFPLVKARAPGAKLFIVGQHPPRSVQALANDDVIVTGFVNDIRAEYLRSTVAVSPIRFGAGTLNKVLEPLALGVPVVATSCGTEGLGLVPGRDILVADDAEGLASHISRVLADPALQRSLGESGALALRSRFSCEITARTLENVYAEILPAGALPQNEDGRP